MREHPSQNPPDRRKWRRADRDQLAVKHGTGNARHQPPGFLLLSELADVVYENDSQ